MFVSDRESQETINNRQSAQLIPAAFALVRRLGSRPYHCKECLDPSRQTPRSRALTTDSDD
jgi:hypothetical protein